MKDLIRIKHEIGNIKPIFGYLKDHGFSTNAYGEDAVIIRECEDISRLNLARKTGTDRDDSSRVCMHRKEIEELGLTPKDITYAKVLGREMLGRDMLNTVLGCFYLLYDPSMMTPIEYDGRILDGDVWKAKGSFYDALILAVQTDRP